MLKIGQRWHHSYDGINDDHHDYHNFVVEIQEINSIYVICQIVQIMLNDNKAYHSTSTIGSTYAAYTIPRDVDHLEGVGKFKANTWTLLCGQEKPESYSREINISAEVDAWKL